MNHTYSSSDNAGSPAIDNMCAHHNTTPFQYLKPMHTYSLTHVHMLPMHKALQHNRIWVICLVSIQLTIKLGGEISQLAAPWQQQNATPFHMGWQLRPCHGLVSCHMNQNTRMW